MVIHPALHDVAWLDTLPTDGRVLEVGALMSLTVALAAHHPWRTLVEHDPGERWYTRLALTPSVEVWLIGWWRGQGTGFHDHGGAGGALAVLEGSLEEVRLGPVTRGAAVRRFAAGSVVALPADTIHRVANPGTVPATSIHAYSPPGLPMRHLDAEGHPRVAGAVHAGALP